MAKMIRCADLMPGCKAVVEGKDAAKVMAEAAEHAQKDHGVTSIPPEMLPKIQAAIKEK